MEKKTPILELISYDGADHERITGIGVVELCTRLKSDHVNWINLDGLYNQDIIDTLQSHFKLHSLLIEDVVSDQRPKAEEFEEYFFFTMKMLYSIQDSIIDYEQISFVLGKDFLITFHNIFWFGILVII